MATSTGQLFSHWRSRRTSSANADQHGFTLIEVMVALVIATLVAGATSAAMILTFRTTKATERRVESSSSGFQTNARFVDDISSATPVGSALAVSRGQQGCGGDTNSVLRVLTRAAGNVEVRSYSITQTGTVLERRTCSGTDLPTALAATPRVNEVTTDLDGGAGAVQVACRANANAALAPATPAGDEQCRIVTLTVKTRTGFEFELEGHRDMTQSPAASVPNVKKCTLLPGADTWVSTYSAGNNYGRDWRNFTVRRSGYGDWNGEKLAYFMVDLLGACTGPGEPPFLPGGKQIMSAEFQIFLIGSAHVSNLEEHSLTALGDPWDEGLLTAQPELRPGVKSGAISRFFDAWPSNKAYTFQVLDEVNHWYDGSWPNYGWVLARGEGNDGHGTDAGFWWGGRESSDSRHWPKLTLTWR